jgi:hypothetical protein
MTYIPWLGFFVDINQFTDNNWRAPELSKESSSDGLPDEDLYPMLKLKFLPFKVFLYRYFQLSFSCSWLTLAFVYGFPFYLT